MVRLFRTPKPPSNNIGLSARFRFVRRHVVFLLLVVAMGTYLLYTMRRVVTAQPWEHVVSYDARQLEDNRIYSTPMGQRLIEESKEFFAELARHNSEAWQRFGRGTIDVRSDEEQKLVNQTNYLAASILTRPYPPLPAFTRPVIDVDCANPIYSHVLTGRRDAQTKLIVDLALFGYDVDLLELRLLEYGDLVHKIVVPEQNLNFKGITKPYLIPTLLEGRLKPFAHLLDHHPQDVLALQKRVRANQMKQNDPDAYKITWTIPTTMRQQTLQYVRDRYGRLDQNISQVVYVIQNDGDEIINRHAMAHFQACELREPGKKVFFAGATYKRNAAWLMHTKDYRKYNRLPLYGKEQNRVKYLRHFVWHLGPIVQRLRDRTDDGIRAWPRPRPPAGERSMGLGAANHFSNPAHPILDFIKHISTVDAQPAPGDADFWNKAQTGALTYVEMRNLTFYCENLDTVGEYRYNPHWVHTASLGPAFADFLFDHLPWAAKQMSDRYPWLYRSDLFPMEQALYDCLCWSKCVPALLHHK